MVTQSDIFGGAEVQLVSAKRLAELLGVSDQSVYNWKKAGMPCTQRDGGDLFDVAACKAWVKANQADFIDGQAKGGRRPGAGRKKTKASTAAAALVKAASAIEQPQTMAATAATGTPGEGNRAFTTAADLLSRLGSEELTGAKARNIRDAIAAGKDLMAIEASLGKRIDAIEVEDAWSLHMRTLRERIDGLAARAAGEIASALALDSDQQKTLREIIDRDIRAILALMATDPFGMLAAEAAQEGEE